METAPELVQFGELTPDHFRRHPVWLQCHVADYDEPWYEETDEETFRPCLEPTPVDPKLGMLLVRATGTLADGTALRGFLTPIFAAGHPGVSHPLGGMQPQLFSPSGHREFFWRGMRAPSPEELRAFYERMGRAAAQIFPIRFLADPGLASGVAAANVEGFYVMKGFRDPPALVR
jgi:hypothetical protein